MCSQASSTSVFRVAAALDATDGAAVSLESLLYPDHYMVHASGQNVEIGLGDACGCAPGTFRTAATFLVTEGNKPGSVQLVPKTGAVLYSFHTVAVPILFLQRFVPCFTMFYNVSQCFCANNDEFVRHLAAADPPRVLHRRLAPCGRPNPRLRQLRGRSDRPWCAFTLLFQ